MFKVKWLIKLPSGCSIQPTLNYLSLIIWQLPTLFPELMDVSRTSPLSRGKASVLGWAFALRLSGIFVFVFVFCGRPDTSAFIFVDILSNLTILLNNIKTCVCVCVCFFKISMKKTNDS